MNPHTSLTVGQHVRRTQGRPANVGREGKVTRIYPDVVGSAGDVLIEVTEYDGGSFTCYDRQVKVIR